MSIKFSLYHHYGQGEREKLGTLRGMLVKTFDGTEAGLIRIRKPPIDLKLTDVFQTDSAARCSFFSMFTGRCEHVNAVGFYLNGIQVRELLETILEANKEDIDSDRLADARWITHGCITDYYKHAENLNHFGDYCAVETLYHGEYHGALGPRNGKGVGVYFMEHGGFDFDLANKIEIANYSRQGKPSSSALMLWIEVGDDQFEDADDGRRGH
jgi:hypothetical protein